MTKYPVFASLLVICAVTAGYAKNPRIPVRGTAADSLTGQGIGYATAALADREGRPVTAVAADSSGRFTLHADTAGTYVLQVTSVGYGPAVREVEVEAPETDLGPVLLTEGVGIDEVVIAVQKPLITADAEKVVYSVENDPEALTGKLSDILRKVPGLSFDAEGKVLLNGQSDYKVLVNGHSSANMSRNFKELIESMPAGSVKKIEVITHPSMKYEAEGTGGIINIITVGRVQNGFNGNISGRYSTGYEAANAYFAVQAGRLALSASYYVSHYKSFRPSRTETDRKNFGNPEFNRVMSSGSNDYNGFNHGFTLNASYEFDSLNLLTAEFSAFAGNNKNFSVTDTRVFDSEGVLVNTSRSESEGRFYWDRFDNVEASINYEHRFGDEDHTLTLSWNIENDPDDGRNTIRTVTGDAVSERIYYEHNKGLNNTLQIDYANSLTDMHSIETGAKYIRRNYRSANPTVTQLPEKSEEYSHTAYTQDILGVYAGYTLSAGKISGRVGARVEENWNNIRITGEEPQSYSPEMFSFIPYLSLSYRPSESHNVHLAYTKRIQRPSIWAMNPSVQTDDKYTVSYGNPRLKPMTLNTLTLSYNFFGSRWSLLFSTSGYHSNSYISGYGFSDADGILNHTWGNVVKYRSGVLSASVSYRTGTKLSVNLNVNGQYSYYNSAALGFGSHGWGVSATLSANVALWKDATLMLNGNYWKSAPYLQNRFDSDRYFYSVGLRQKLFKQKLELGVSTYNPFNEYSADRSRTSDDTYTAHHYNRWYSRGFSFSASFRFGKKEVEVKSTAGSIENDDMMEGGNK